MGKVVVVTDSSATVPAHLARDLDIRVVPIVLAWNGRVYRDGVDLTPGELYRRLRTDQHPPTTSAPSVGHFLRAYVDAVPEATGIVSIHMSSHLSATYDAAWTASRLVDTIAVRVLDCRTAAMAQGFVVLAAARAAATGADLEAVLAEAERVAERVSLLASLDTLEYLHRGGRIGGAAALVGSLLQIKPVVSIADGRVAVFSRPRTRARAIECMVHHLAQKVGGRPAHVAIMHADEPEGAAELRLQVEETCHCAELFVTEFTPVMGAHTGPGLLGLAFYEALDGRQPVTPLSRSTSDASSTECEAPARNRLGTGGEAASS